MDGKYYENLRKDKEKKEQVLNSFMIIDEYDWFLFDDRSFNTLKCKF